MRPLWKGSISFGLVNIPVRLFAATEQKSVKFRYLHEPCRTPVEYRKVCPSCKKEVPMEEIVKGYEYETGRFVIIEESDLAKIPEETTKSIAIVDFVRQDEVDPVYYDRSYYLAPGETGEKAFQLLQQSMAEAGMVAIVRIVLRSRQALGVLRVYDHTLAVETMFYPDEVRPTAELPTWNRDTKVHDNELKMARELIKNLTADFAPEKYTDEYRKALLEIIEGKIAGEEVYIAPAAEKGEVVDLMEALKASVQATRDSTGTETGRKRRQKAGVGTA
jgi:DNA end-binding protein Ku